MNKKVILKIIIGIIFIPFILGTGIAIFDFIEDGIEYVITTIIIEILLIWGYFKLNKKINNIKIETKEKIGIINKLKSKDKLKEEVEQKYEKITDTFWINQKEKIVLINDISFKFCEILSAELVEESIEKNTISGIGKTHNTFGSMYGVGLSSKLINKLDVEIKTTKMSNAFINIPFLKVGLRIGVDKNSKKYKEAYVKAQKCLSILQLIIKENNNIDETLT